ncbi:glycosyltransferase family 4 protein [Sulfitobacter albidus]|uniref:Glycosyltransferase family 4 protein n=1 Tax=Sulfitobacter albidus TaxID=2829501 RepID=A0A975JCN1_9RHOB|nr:glycosyltransferase family 4 protein [Sulfitobacter albidus]QUJ76021.1 glycosyltransferase family 4 protein [Sulfitobacter albidus]
MVLFNAVSQPTHAAVLSKLDVGVAYYEAGAADAHLDEIVRRHDVDIIHSSIWWADKTVDEYRDKLPAQIPWIISMHGCHETFIQHPQIDGTFPERMQRMLTRASAWVYTAEKNLAIFDSYPRPETLLRIPNGMRTEPIGTTLRRADLGLREDALVLCLASRAIASKGWGEAVDLTATLNAQGHKVDLMLIGEGPAADAVRADAPAHVHLMGQVANLQDYLAIADIGLLPSYFVGESLPLVLIEMMAKGLPLIATDIGEIASILGEGDEAAGILVPLEGEGVDRAALERAATRMLDPGVRAAFGAQSHARYDAQFTLERMVNRYETLYSDVGALRWKHPETHREGPG